MNGKFELRRTDGPLQPYTRITRIKRAVFLDTETGIVRNPDNTIDFPFRLGFMTYREYTPQGLIKTQEDYPFFTRQEGIDFIQSHLSTRSRLYVFAHNIGFDLRVLGLRDLLATLAGKSEPPIMNQRIFIFDVHTEQGLVTFLDTANYGAISVKQLGKDLGFPKLEIDFNTAPDQELLVYCQRDVEILAKFVETLQSFLIEHDLGPTKHTLASQSLATFKYRFMHNPPHIHTNEKAIQLEADGYKGGRTECFHIGKLPPGDYYYLDVNSIYPYSMASNRLPVRLLGYSENVPLSHLRVRLAKNYVIADVLLSTEANAYPYTDNGKLLFPVGTFRTVLHSPELAIALASNSILHVYRCAVYKPGKIFDEYVAYFMALKEQYTRQSNSSFRLIVKLLLNSLYGKFGQEKVIRTKVGITARSKIFRIPGINMDTKDRYCEIAWLGVIFRETKGGETPHTFKGLAGAVTSYSRALMWEYMNMAGLDNVFYMDTDSLIVNKQGYANLSDHIDQYRLGALKLENTSSQVTITGPKDYIFGDITHIKGVPPGTGLNKLGKWEYTQFEGLITFINNGAMGYAKGYLATKERKQAYSKGIVDPQTGIVRPIRKSL